MQGSLLLHRFNIIPARQVVYRTCARGADSLPCPPARTV